MSDIEEEEVMERLQGKALPPKCPHCGKRLYQVYSREPVLEWSDKRYYHTPYFGENPDLCCVSCHIRLDDDLQKEIETQLS